MISKIELPDDIDLTEDRDFREGQSRRHTKYNKDVLPWEDNVILQISWYGSDEINISFDTLNTLISDLQISQPIRTESMDRFTFGTSSNSTMSVRYHYNNSIAGNSWTTTVSDSSTPFSLTIKDNNGSDYDDLPCSPYKYAYKEPCSVDPETLKVHSHSNHIESIDPEELKFKFEFIDEFEEMTAIIPKGTGSYRTKKIIQEYNDNIMQMSKKDRDKYLEKLGDVLVVVKPITNKFIDMVSKYIFKNEDIYSKDKDGNINIPWVADVDRNTIWLTEDGWFEILEMNNHFNSIINSDDDLIESSPISNDTVLAV